MNKLKLLPYILFAGLIADASYLSYKYYQFYYQGGFLASLGCTDDCDTVMMSPYAMLFKIPIPFYGLGFYLLVLSIYILCHRQGIATPATQARDDSGEPVIVRHAVPKHSKNKPDGLFLRSQHECTNLSSQILDLLMIAGLIAAAIFIYIMYFKLHAVCKFCLAAHAMFVTLAVLYFSVLRR